MNVRLTLYVQGGLLIFLGCMLATPIPVSIYYRDGQVVCFAVSALSTILTGAVLFLIFRSREEITIREGFAIVTFGWISFAFFGSLPFLISGTLPSPVDAIFESMSGFATAGASVIADVESVSKSILFWRSLTQWLGGMGIILLGMAILPLLGVGGMQLYEAEAPGPTADRLTPRIQDTARLLWGVYALVTVIGILFLWWGDMDLFDAVCHTFTAIATGGFSTRNASIGAFSTYNQVVTIVIMLVGGANFFLHYYALRGNMKKYWSSDEFRFYVIVWIILVVIASLFNGLGYDSVWTNLRDSAFTVTSVFTTTGFATVDYERWSVLGQGLLFSLMFVGGCAGSTAGGLKQVRVVLLLKHAFLQTAHLLHPRRVKMLKLDHRPVSPEIMQDVLGFTVLFFGVFIVGSLLLTAVNVDILTAGSSVISCLSSVGPGLGGVGPMDNYASLPNFAKIVLSLCMLLGRLEISTVLVLLFPTFWKK